jgi:GNAT superfamily N-acetyltransferase
MVLAGHVAMMMRRGYQDIEVIPVNPEIRVEVLDADDEAAVDATLDIVAEGFKWPEGRKHRLRGWWHERARDATVREHEIRYLAWVENRAVGYCQLTLRAGLACLDGAATLPEYRGRRVYSTLLRRRLADARDCGYPIAIIDAHPMARRVVARYGFEEYARLACYGWMPEIDMDVIRSLVSTE